MKKQRTLSIIKPDAVLKNESSAICKALAEAGLSTIAFKENYRLTREEAEQFYKEHYGKPFFESLIQSMTAGPIFLQVLEGDNVIERYRDLMGSTDPQQAKPNTLRAQFGGKVLPTNAVHGSDSVKSATREIHFFFKSLPTL